MNIHFSVGVPSSVINSVARCVDLCWRSIRSLGPDMTYNLKEGFKSEHFYEAFERIAKDNRCAVVFSVASDRYTFSPMPSMPEVKAQQLLNKLDYCWAERADDMEASHARYVSRRGGRSDGWTGD